MDLTVRQSLILRGVICPYCGKDTKLVNSIDVYGDGHNYGMMYVCHPCKAWVGCHGNTTEALGRLANAELRMWKAEAHKQFDAIWRYANNTITRKQAYAMLSKYLNIPPEYTHIGMFGVETCKKVVKFAQHFFNNAKPTT